VNGGGVAWKLESAQGGFAPTDGSTIEVEGLVLVSTG
jgi:hypothetical protein